MQVALPVDEVLALPADAGHAHPVDAADEAHARHPDPVVGLLADADHAHLVDVGDDPLVDAVTDPQPDGDHGLHLMVGLLADADHGLRAHHAVHPRHDDDRHPGGRHLRVEQTMAVRPLPAGSHRLHGAC